MEIKWMLKYVTGNVINRALLIRPEVEEGNVINSKEFFITLPASTLGIINNAQLITLPVTYVLLGFTDVPILFFRFEEDFVLEAIAVYKENLVIKAQFTLSKNGKTIWYSDFQQMNLNKVRDFI